MQKGSEGQQGFNRQLASGIRPGASLEQVRAVWGSRWQEPTRKDAGYVGLRDKLGFTVRLDRQGRVGEVGFHSNFPNKYSIEGLLLGMPLAAVLEARRGLKELPDPDDNWPGRIRYGEAVQAGYTLIAGFMKGKEQLAFITLEFPECEYPDPDEYVPAPPGKYREVSAKTPPTFPDPNLKLAVFNALLRSGAIDLGTIEELFMHVRGRFVDMADAEYELASDVLDFLARYPLTAAELASVEQLWLDANSDIVEFVWPKFDGETEEFHIRSFAGIEKCPNVREVAAIVDAHIDCTPLLGLAKLESFSVSEGSWLANPDEQLAALRARGISTPASM